jgi:hypothetical protein
MKMEQIECSETSAYKIQTPGNYPEENTQHTEHGGSLKSRTASVLLKKTSQIPWIYINSKCLKQSNPVDGGNTTMRYYIQLIDQVSPIGNASDLYL